MPPLPLPLEFIDDVTTTGEELEMVVAVADCWHEFIELAVVVKDDDDDDDEVTMAVVVVLVLMVVLTVAVINDDVVVVVVVVLVPSGRDPLAVCKLCSTKAS